MNIEFLETGVCVVDSGIDGPILSVIGGIYGDEKCGIQLLDHIREGDFRIKKGKLYLLYGNLDAIKQNTRQCDMNLNRIFKADIQLTEQEKKTREYAHMKRIRQYLDVSQASLDLHSSPSLGSPVFAIAEENAFPLLEALPIENICTGFSQGEAGGTDGYMYNQGKVGVCIECGYHGDREGGNRAKEVLYKFLEYYGLVFGEGEKSIRKQFYFQASGSYITKTAQFRVIKSFHDFEEIKKGQLIGYDADDPVYAKGSGYILFARDRSQPGVEGFMELTTHPDYK